MLANSSTTAPATLAAGASFVCTYTGTWHAGQNTNTAAASVGYTDGAGNTASANDSDDANYFVAFLSVDLTTKSTLFPYTTLFRSNTAPGPTLLSGHAAPQFQITVHNTS